MTAAGWPFAVAPEVGRAFGALEQALDALPDLDRYREILWAATLEHVAAIPRYQGQGGRTPEAFGLLSAEDVAASETRHDLYHPAVPRELIFTSGGTSGRVKLMPHSYAQIAAMSLLEEATLERLRRRGDSSAHDGVPFARLRVLDTFHGPRFPWPGGPAVQHLALGCHHAADVPAIRDVLSGAERNPVRGRPVTEMVADMWKLTVLGAALDGSHLDPAECTLARIYAGGFSSSPNRRRWFETVFGARFVELYGSTEVWQGNVQRCVACGLFHQPLTVLHDYRETGLPDDHRELVVTTLVPFALTMPLIRYRTGDVVRLGPTCPRTGAVGFDYVGRRVQTRHFADDGLVLSPLPVATAVADLPGLRRLYTDDVLDRDITVPDELRIPVYRCEPTADGFHVTLELAAGGRPRRDPADLLRAALAERDPRIAARVTVSTVAPGELATTTFL